MVDASNIILCKTSNTQLKKGALLITKGDGIKVFDQNGKAYLDFVAGFTRAVLVGYGRKEIAQAVYDQICELPYFISMEFASIPSITLSNMLAEITPGKINKFFFVCDGSEAIESAIKLARHYQHSIGQQKRYKVISRRGAYHGTTMGALSVTGTMYPMRHIMEPLVPGAIFVEAPYCYRCPFRLTYPDCDVFCARDIERIIEFEDPGQISAFIGEPIQQGFGAFPPPKEYWQIIRDICNAHGILLIIDEVICGFGRTGEWFGIEHFNIQPDIITMAKGISSGYVPLGGVGCTDNIMESIDIFQHLHTYANHPVSCAAAVKNIEILQKEDLIQRSREMGVYLFDRLKSLESHPIVGETRCTGLWAAIDLTTDKVKRNPFPSERLSGLVKRALGKGLIIKSMGNALKLAPALIVNKAEIDDAVNIIDECLAEEEQEMAIAS